MKLIRLAQVLIIGLTLTLAAGCRKGPTMTTKIPGSEFGKPDVPGEGEGKSGTIKPNELFEGYPANNPTNHAGWAENADIFKANTVHFAFDSSVVRDSEKSNVSAVASHLKGDAAAAVRVEGHCDERGTAEYNRSLGERRAQAIRTELVSLGIDASRVDTISYGFERPVDSSHSESAWSKNRRGEFILLTPPAK